MLFFATRAIENICVRDLWGGCPSAVLMPQCVFCAWVKMYIERPSSRCMATHRERKVTDLLSVNGVCERALCVERCVRALEKRPSPQAAARLCAQRVLVCASEVLAERASERWMQHTLCTRTEERIDCAARHFQCRAKLH